MIRIWIAAALTLSVFGSVAQDKTTSKSNTNQADTVIVSLAKTSKVVFTVQDKDDLQTLKYYNFQALFDDIIRQLENKNLTGKTSEPSTSDTTRVSDSTHVAQDDIPPVEDWSTDEPTEEEDREWQVRVNNYKRGRIGRTWQSFNFDLGTNNYLGEGNRFPDTDDALYAVRPWGSWYVALSSTQRTRIGKNFFLEWGAGISWYNFKFQKDDILISKADNMIQFTRDERDLDHIKSKLMVNYINISVVPVLDFGDNSRKPRLWEGYASEFRIGIGPYVGYRIGSRSKVVYKDDGDRERERERDNFYLNNIRYGARLQFGFRSTDLFFNYDFNDLFIENKGPKLNAFSFGVIF